MILHPPYGPVFLMPGQAIRLASVGPLMLQVRSGTVWMTQAGRNEDHIISTDESRCIDPGADVVLSAFVPARVDLLQTRAGCASEQAPRQAARFAGPVAA